MATCLLYEALLISGNRFSFSGALEGRRSRLPMRAIFYKAFDSLLTVRNTHRLRVHRGSAASLLAFQDKVETWIVRGLDLNYPSEKLVYTSVSPLLLPSWIDPSS